MRLRTRIAASGVLAALVAALGPGQAAYAAPDWSRVPIPQAPAALSPQWNPAPMPEVAGAAARTVKPVPDSAGHLLVGGLPAPLTTAQCQAKYKISCYDPAQVRTAYDLPRLYGRGLTGAGRTVVIVDPFGYANAQSDLDHYDAQWNLPPVTVHVLTPDGPVPGFDPTNGDSVGWAVETMVDLESVHAYAPGATIDLVETPVSETQGVTGFPEINEAIEKVVASGVGDVITQSFGSAEADFPSAASIMALRGGYEAARAAGVSVTAGSGDVGADGIALNNTDLLPEPSASYPASDPLVTAVGGTQLSLDAQGRRLSADVAWNDGHGATGGGFSQYFARPVAQNPVASAVGAMRGVPDISATGAVNGGNWVYTTATNPAGAWGVYGGTSFSSPIFASVVAIADQQAGHRLGLLNDALYRLYAAKGYTHRSGLIDVTSGNNVFGASAGYQATTGWDPVDGLGTFDAAQLADALADCAH